MILGFLAVSGLFVLKGKNGLSGRGKWLTGIGVAIPLLALLFLLWRPGDRGPRGEGEVEGARGRNAPERGTRGGPGRALGSPPAPAVPQRASPRAARPSMPWAPTGRRERMTPNASSRAVRAISRMPSSDLSLLLQVGGALAASLDLEEVLQTAIESAVRALQLEHRCDLPPRARGADPQAPRPRRSSGVPGRVPARAARRAPEREAVRRGARARVAGGLGFRGPDHRRARRLRGSRAALPPLRPGPRGGGSGRRLHRRLGRPRPRVRRRGRRPLRACPTEEIGLALANARLHESLQKSHEELEKAYDATIEGWSLALEMRDDETQGHALRVADLAVELGRAMGIAGEGLVHLRRGALLHDIGKMVVPDAILLKPGPLTRRSGL